MDKSIDAIEIYKDYFNKKRNVIVRLIQYYNNKQKSMALWGAGKKGIGLLKSIGDFNKMISCVFDKDRNKVGIYLETGHRIEDFFIHKTNIIFVANGMFSQEVTDILSTISPDTKVINVENIILGDLKFEDIIYEKKFNSAKKKNNKICATIVLYNPDMSVLDNVNSYVDNFEKVYLYDNSTKKNIEVIRHLNKIKNIVMLGGNGNSGLSVAFNETAKIAKKEGYAWMSTFDQDSVAGEGMVATMKKYVNSYNCDNKIAIIAPVICNNGNKIKIQEEYFTYTSKVIQSGAMNNLEIMQKIGGYDEKLFIDEVDYEYCTRCIVEGYKIIILNNAILLHNKQDLGVTEKFEKGITLHINKYSSDRYYYRYRNALYCYDKYKDIYPLYALDCKNTIRKLDLQLEYDSEYSEHIEAVKQAIYDYKNGNMGKRKGNVVK